MSVTQNTHHHRPLMVQAPVRALDPDGVAVVSAGTVAFAIAAVTCWVLRADLEATGRLWYLGVSVTGTVLGLLGLAFGLFRKARRHRLEAADLPEAADQIDAAVRPEADGLPGTTGLTESGDDRPVPDAAPRRALEE